MILLALIPIYLVSQHYDVIAETLIFYLIVLAVIITIILLQVVLWFLGREFRIDKETKKLSKIDFSTTVKQITIEDIENKLYYFHYYRVEENTFYYKEKFDSEFTTDQATYFISILPVEYIGSNLLQTLHEKSKSGWYAHNLVVFFVNEFDPSSKSNVLAYTKSWLVDLRTSYKRDQGGFPCIVYEISTNTFYYYKDTAFFNSRYGNIVKSFFKIINYQSFKSKIMIK
jgi:hypothetical protein